MNILLDRLPTEVEIAGRAVPIATSFRHGILFEQFCLDSSLAEQEQMEQALRLMYPTYETDPYSVLAEPQQALDGLLWFWRCGDRRQNRYQLRKQKQAEMLQEDTEQAKLCYDYDFDSERIYAAFWQQYGIDLDRTSLHWWKFRALFLGLGEQTKFMQVVGYRTIKITKDMSDSQKKFYREMKEQYAIPRSQNEMEKESAMEQALMNQDTAALMKLLREGGG